MRCRHHQLDDCCIFNEDVRSCVTLCLDAHTHTHTASLEYFRVGGHSFIPSEPKQELEKTCRTPSVVRGSLLSV